MLFRSSGRTSLELSLNHYLHTSKRELLKTKQESLSNHGQPSILHRKENLTPPLVFQVLHALAPPYFLTSFPFVSLPMFAAVSHDSFLTLSCSGCVFLFVLSSPRHCCILPSFCLSTHYLTGSTIIVSSVVLLSPFHPALSRASPIKKNIIPKTPENN